MTTQCAIPYCNHPNGPCTGGCTAQVEKWRAEARQAAKSVANIPGFEQTPHVAPASALATQVGGDHYKKLAIQPMQYSMANKLDACQHTAIKYITRFRDKGGVADLEKAKHVIDMLIEFESRS
jgi:hypothetical protein